MACDALPRQCLEWHILPKLRKARPIVSDDGVLTGCRALCPAHIDRHHSFSIGVGDDGRWILHQCFVCKNRRRERNALIDTCGVPRGCLPVPASEKQELLDFLGALLSAPTDNHAEIRLRAMAAMDGYYDLPRGKELERIAGKSSVSPASAYGYRKRGSPVTTDKTTSYPSDGKPVKPRRSA